MNTISHRELEPFLQKLCKRLQCPGGGIVFIMNTTPDEIEVSAFISLSWGEDFFKAEGLAFTLPSWGGDFIPGSIHHEYDFP